MKSVGTLPSGRSGTWPLMNSSREPAATSQAPAYAMEFGLMGRMIVAMVASKASRRFMRASLLRAARGRLGENC
jgi:hypothetical protein